MTTIIATPDSSTASIRLEISTTSSVQRVLRNDVNGVAEVRALMDQLPSTYVSTIARTNLATNPIPGSVSGWTTSSAYARTFETVLDRPAIVVTKSGTGSYVWYGRNMGTLGTATGTPTTTAGLVPVTPGATVYTQVDMGTDAVGVNGWLVVRFFNGSGAEVAGTVSNGSKTVMKQDAWETITHEAVVPAGAAYAYVENVIQLLSGNTVGGERAWAGRAYIGLTPGPYFDGSTPADNTGIFSWTGTENASTSVQRTGGTVILTDYEASAGINTYSVEEKTDTEATATAELVLDSPWLLVPVLPNYSEQVQTITNYASQRQAQSTVHTIIGRTDPLVAFGVLGDRTGTLEIFCDSLAQARTLETVFNRGEVVMLKQNVEGMDMYFTGNSTVINPYSAEGEKMTRYAMTVQYTELKRPIGNLAGALGWNFDELAASYASFNAVTLKFATFNDLTIRKEK